MSADAVINLLLALALIAFAWVMGAANDRKRDRRRSRR